MRRTVWNQRGFTLTELLVASSIIAIVMGGMFTVLASGQQTFLTGANQVEAQQTLRLTVSRMVQEIRDAGYCPTCGSAVPITAFAAITGATTTGFTIQNDWNGNWDGAAGISAAGTVPHVVVGTNGAAAAAIQRGEQITYAYNSVTRIITRQETGIDAAPVTLATGVSALTLTYLTATGTTVALPTTAATALTIRQVIVSFVGQPANQPTTFQTGRVQVTMTDTVRLRNRAL